MPSKRNLVIVESAAKAKTIQKYLNSIPQIKDYGTFVVHASFGHINDLPQKEVGIDKDTWTATYVPIEGKRELIKKLQSEVKKSDVIYLASDLDMEGEAIAFHLQDVLHIPKTKMHRITFNEITKSALLAAVTHPRNVDMNMVNAQEARRMLDRVVGYELSPLLWRRFATGKLSAGRVQSAALKMIVDRAHDATSHTPEPFWEIDGTFISKDLKDPLQAKAFYNGKVAMWDEEKSIVAVMRHLWKRNVKAEWIADFTQKESKRNPPPPFVTSSLQQEAYTRFGLPAKKTMQIAQSLYESGYITYMRTDSPAISNDAQQAIIQYLEETYGTALIQARVFKAKAANAQEAHECIRPANVHKMGKDLALDGIQKKLYDLIWRRTIASQMVPAVYADMCFTISSKECEYQFVGKISILKEEGYLLVYSPETKSNKKELEKWGHKQVIVTPTAFKAQGDVTKPKSLYNEPALVKMMEKEGIGRPSTYASIVDKLFSKGYVTKGTNPQTTVHVNSYIWSKGKTAIQKEEETVVVGGSGTDFFVPSGLGERVIEYLDEVVPELLNVKFTSHMEDELDDISGGNKGKTEVLTAFYRPFNKAVQDAIKHQKEEAKKRPKKEKQPAELKPSNVLRDFERIGVQVVQTRYGPALFNEREKRFASVMPLLTWRRKTIDELSEKEVMFVMSLPRKYEGTTRELAMGRYGLYVKDTNGNINMRLKKELWDSALNGNLTAKDVISIETPPPAALRKRKAAAYTPSPLS
jgi:DNA topoisomerase-1